MDDKMKNYFGTEVPGHQSSLNIFRGGWTSRIPSEDDLVSGQADNFNDGRVPWAEPLMGGFEGKRILELGPFEAYNTYQMEKRGAEVTAVEGSLENFFKCLIVKNIIDLRAKFLFGDFNKIQSGEKYDAVWASGVLYHMIDPIALLETISSLSNRIFIWTQYYDKDVLVPTHPAIGHFDSKKNIVVDFFGRTITYYWRSYLDVSKSGTFSGGSESYAYWMTLPDILHVLQSRGFSVVDMGVNNPDFPPGPACFFLATRP